MRYPASEKLDDLNLVEQSHLRTKQIIDRLGYARVPFLILVMFDQALH